MKREKWIVWKPIEEIPETLYLEELKYDSNGLTLSLTEKDDAPILIIHFDEDLSHRIADEGNLLRTVSKAERSQEALRWTLFKVENSLYLQWFHEESSYKYESDNLVHYLIATPNEIVDVLNLNSPTLKWS